MPYSVSPFFTACERLPPDDEEDLRFVLVVVTFGFVFDLLALALLLREEPCESPQRCSSLLLAAERPALRSPSAAQEET